MAKYVKIKSPSSLLVPGKISHFLHYLGYFWQEAAGSQVKGSESKFDLSFHTRTIPGQLLAKKFDSSIF